MAKPLDGIAFSSYTRRLKFSKETQELLKGIRQSPPSRTPEARIGVQFGENSTLNRNEVGKQVMTRQTYLPKATNLPSICTTRAKLTSRKRQSQVQSAANDLKLWTFCKERPAELYEFLP